MTVWILFFSLLEVKYPSMLFAVFHMNCGGDNAEQIAIQALSSMVQSGAHVVKHEAGSEAFFRFRTAVQHGCNSFASTADYL